MLNIIRILAVALLFFWHLPCVAQEICDNGIDDDHDGLIDLQDIVDCHCNSESITSLIPNSSFEDTLCCPTGFSQMRCAKDWIQASASTSDYFNVCGFTHIYSKPPPFALGGDGYVGYYDIDVRPSSLVYKEYVGTCLNSTLKAGESYQLQFYMAHGNADSVTSIAVFGSPKCSNLPFGGRDVNFGCPTNGTGWIGLDSAEVTFITNAWQLVTLNFTPPTDINAIVLGPGCRSVLERTSATGDSTFGGKNYYFLDGLTLNKESAFYEKSLIYSSRLHCPGDITLNVRFKDKPKAIQWYKDQIAILGETRSNYTVPRGSVGQYQVRLLYDDTCVISLPYSVSDSSILDYDACDATLQLFNVFTPGKDGFNDQWEVLYEGYDKVDIEIFNRWGENVVQYRLPGGKPWNGRIDNTGEPCPDGTYFYMLTAFDSKSGAVHKRSGTITLINE